MPIKRIKDKTSLLSSCRLWANGREHYWDVYLWPDREAMHANTVAGEDADALHVPLSTPMDPESGEILPWPKVGELHFVKSSWDLETLAHELCHALLHRQRCLCPGIQSLMSQDVMGKEEKVCYEFGRWVAELYRWLWTVAPPENLHG